jgi:polysaccharide pyruvyl transferase WcaK-like protein
LKTLFLGSYGFGNLGDELCLIEAMRAFPSSEVWAYSNDPAFTASGVAGIHGFIRKRAEIRDLKPDRVVLGGGGVGFFPSIRDSLHWMSDALSIGAKCHIHNIGVAWLQELDWAKAPEVQAVLSGLSSCSVRDHVSWFAMRAWPGDPRPSITYYPETNLTQDDALTTMLPDDRPLLGISITGQSLMRAALRGNQDRIKQKLALYQDFTIIPIISTVSLTDPEEDDVAGFWAFKQLFLDGFQVACEEFLDKIFWRDNLTPLKLKGVIGGLDAIFTQRKHNLIHAIGMGTPAVGIYPTVDDSIARIFYTMRDRMPQDSSQLALLDRTE